MAFQIKDFASITASMINRAKATQDKITDYNIGSVARTLMESPAIEIEELYQRMLFGILEAIPVSTYLSFDFDKLPALNAFGYITVSSTPKADDFPVPAGTVFTSADGRRYLTETAAVWVAGQTSVRLLVKAEASGVVGNIGAGLITQADLFPVPEHTIQSDAIQTGRDEETEDERKMRFAEFIASLSRGTSDALRYAVQQIVVMDEYVARVGLADLAGHVSIFVYSSRGLPSDALLAQAQRVVDGYIDEATGVRVAGYRPAGVRVDVLSMTERVINLTVRVSMLPGFNLDATTINQMRSEFASEVAAVESGGVLLIDAIVERLLSLTGVHRAVPATTANVPCGDSEVLVPGTLTVEALDV